MPVKAPLGDAQAYRHALEPLTMPMRLDDETEDGSTIAFCSMAVSLKRIADSLDRLLEQNKFKR